MVLWFPNKAKKNAPITESLNKPSLTIDNYCSSSCIAVCALGWDSTQGKLPLHHHPHRLPIQKNYHYIILSPGSQTQQHCSERGLWAPGKPTLLWHTPVVIMTVLSLAGTVWMLSLVGLEGGCFSSDHLLCHCGEIPGDFSCWPLQKGNPLLLIHLILFM